MDDLERKTKRLAQARKQMRRVLFPNVSSFADRIRGGGLLRPRERMERLPKESERKEAEQRTEAETVEKEETDQGEVVKVKNPSSRPRKRGNAPPLVGRIRDEIENRLEIRRARTRKELEELTDEEKKELEEEKEELEREIEEMKREKSDREKKPWAYSSESPAGVSE